MGVNLHAVEANGEDFISLARDAICCPVCDDPFKTAEPHTPCILPCFHTFCRLCLQGWAKRSSAQGDGFCCPTCHSTCPVAVDALPLNYALMTVIEAEHISTGQMRMECQDCVDVCEATHFCPDCNLLLCTDCGAHHGKRKMTNHHILLPAAEFKQWKQALPRGRRMCKKHKDQELRLFCKTCMTPICYDGTFKDHKGHDHELLTDVAELHVKELCKEADRMAHVQATLEVGITRIKEEESLLELEAAEQTTTVKQHFDELVNILCVRGEAMTRDIEEARIWKSKVLAGQRDGLEHAVASMASGSEHAQRIAKLGDEFEVMDAYNRIVTGMHGLRVKQYELHPNTYASIRFVDSSWGDTRQCLMQHGRVVAREVKPMACVAEGKGLSAVYTSSMSEFTVRVVGYSGEWSTDGGDDVQVRLMGVSGGQDEDTAVDVGKDVRVTDRGDGTYACRYEVKEGTPVQEARLEVRVNGGHVAGSPFQVAIEKGVRLSFTAPFDDKGVLHFIATDGGTCAYANPHDSGRVVASMSSIADNNPQYGDPRRFVQGASHDGQSNYTNNQAGSWMAVDLKRQLIPSHYCLRSDGCSGGNKMRHWRLEGSNDGSSWTTLREHSNDTALAGDAFPAAHWPLPDVATAYRHFRIYQTGKNSSNHDNLMFAGIELYRMLLGADAE